MQAQDARAVPRAEPLSVRLGLPLGYVQQVLRRVRLFVQEPDFLCRSDLLCKAVSIHHIQLEAVLGLSDGFFDTHG